MQIIDFFVALAVLWLLVFEFMKEGHEEPSSRSEVTVNSFQIMLFWHTIYICINIVTPTPLAYLFYVNLYFFYRVNHSPFSIPFHRLQIIPNYYN